MIPATTQVTVSAVIRQKIGEWVQENNDTETSER